MSTNWLSESSISLYLYNYVYLTIDIYKYIFAIDIHNYFAIDVIIYEPEIKTHFLKCTNILESI